MRGGKRLGAGRKPGFAAKNAEEARRILSEMVVREIRPIGVALIAKAKKGDIRAASELFDRSFGRAPQAIGIKASAELLPLPIFGLDFDELSEETLSRFAFTSEERAVLERRLIPRRLPRSGASA